MGQREGDQGFWIIPYPCTAQVLTRTVFSSSTEKKKGDAKCLKFPNHLVLLPVNGMDSFVSEHASVNRHMGGREGISPWE